MLVVVSDLHLQQTALDHLHYRKGNELRRTGVRRNVTAGAVDRWFGMIRERAERHGSKEVHLIFAGDIFEIHRSPQWLLGGNDVRPTTHPRTKRQKEAVLAILDAIHTENVEFWNALKQGIDGREFLKPASRLPKLQVHFLPGNHDRLANAWPEVRKKVRELLRILPPDESTRFPNKHDFSLYGVRVRHGHEYDKTNFSVQVQGANSLSASSARYLEPCFGDYITVDVATRLALAFRAMNAEGLHEPVTGQRLRELYNALTEFDDVRPQSLIVEYLLERMGAGEGEVLEYLRPALRDMVDLAVENPFFRRWAERLGYWNSALVTLLREALKNFSASTLESAVKRVVSSTRGEKREGPADIAMFEPGLGEKFDVVIGGHTHHPELVPLPPAAIESYDPLYLDSGTWRTTLPYGKRRFGRLRAYTMIFCYDDIERKAEHSDGRRFETWTGHLAAGNAVAFDEPVRATVAPPGKVQLVFKRLEVKKVQESGFLSDGAELSIRLGVDGTGRAYRKDGVKSGASVSLTHVEPIPLDPGLDGEVWFWGNELDLGASLIDRDDPLPWAADRLPRVDPTSRYSQFKIAAGKLIIKARSEHFVLHYAVENI